MTARDPHKHRRRARMHPQPIHNRDFLFDFVAALAAVRFAIQKAH
jgi:hypothetical protein